MTNYVYIGASLDGFIAAPDGGLDWLDEIPNPDNDDFGFADFMSGVDAILMGRKTFETLLTFDSWPYEKPIFVLSDSISQVPESVAGKAEIVRGDPKNLVKLFNQKGFKNLYIDGGVTIQGFLQEDLIDEMIITRIPVLLGDGIPLFGSLNSRLKFKHKRTVVFNNALVKSHYIRDR